MTAMVPATRLAAKLQDARYRRAGLDHVLFHTLRGIRLIAGRRMGTTGRNPAGKARIVREVTRFQKVEIAFAGFWDDGERPSHPVSAPCSKWAGSLAVG